MEFVGLLAFISVCEFFITIEGTITYNVTLTGGYPTECRLTPGGHEYAGFLNTTIGGYTCQPWKDTEPHWNYFHDQHEDFPELTTADASNNCRNPDSGWDEGTWCYTTDSNKRYDDCEVPLCECKLTALGRDYQGRINRTSSGLACQRWDAQTPNAHNFTRTAFFSGEHLMRDLGNYCRNPNGSRSGPWCYTTSAGTQWEYCTVQTCDFDLVTFTTTTIPTITTTTTTTTTTSSTTPSPTTTITAPTTTTTTTTQSPTANAKPATTRRTTTTRVPSTRPTSTTTTTTTTATTTREPAKTERPKEPAIKEPTVDITDSGKPGAGGKPAASTSAQSSTITIVSVVVPVVVVAAIIAVVIVLYRRGIIFKSTGGGKQKLEETYDNPSYDVASDNVNVGQPSSTFA